MQPRTTILAALAAGPVLGLLLGLAVHPVMLSAPEPHWRKAQPDRLFTRSQVFVDAGPQDLDPRWEADRTPTWKRREAERLIAERTALENAAYPTEAPYMTAELPVQDDADSALASADRSPAIDAAAAAQTVTAAVAEPEESAAKVGG